MGKGMAGRASAWMLGLSFLVTIAGVVAWLQVRARAAEDAGFPAGTYAYLDDASQLFLGAPAPVRQAGAAAPGLPPGSHPIRISRDAARRAAERGFVPVVLPDGTRYDVRFEREEHAFTGDWTFVGRVDTPFGALASVLTFGPDGVFGTLPAPDGRMFHVTTSHGISTIAPAGDIVPPGATPTDLHASDIALPPAPSGQRATQPTPQPGAHGGEVAEAAGPGPVAATQVARSRSASSVPGDEVVIDLLGVYTSDLVHLRGSIPAAKSEYASLVAITNQAHADSGSGVRFRIVGLQETDLAADVPNDEALDLLTDSALPDGLDVSALRDELQADFVALVRPYPEGSPSCGIAWLNGWSLHPEWASARYAFSVSNVAPCGPFVLAHELGHNLGSSHDIQAATFWDVQYGAFPFSFGYREGGSGGFATVMAYTQGEPWIGRFSDPTVLACGGARRCGSDLADNRRSMGYMAAGASLFRMPPGAIGIGDAHALESEGHVDFLLELSSRAPAGGVSYRVATRDGTARAGDDYVAAVVEGSIPSGGTRALVRIALVDDAGVDPDEWFDLVIEQLEGATAAREVATGRILDDDPRTRITGKLVFPNGVEPPSSSIRVEMTGTEGRPDTTRILTLEPPLFEYDVAVVPGYEVVWRIEMPEPFADVLLEFGQVDDDMARDVQVAAAARVRGRVLFDEGDPLPATVQVRLDQSSAPGGPPGFIYYAYAAPPLYEFDLEAVPGRFATLKIASPPAPYKPQSISLPDLVGDVRQDIRLRTLPGASMPWYQDRERERDEELPTWLGFSLSAPAPAGGVRITVASRDGTATAGEDYVGFEATLDFAAGQQYQGFEAILSGDHVPEDDEWFEIVVTGIEGAWAKDPVHRFTIIDDDLPRTVSSDADGDGRSDLAWFSAAEGELVAWSMQGATVAAVRIHPLPGWTSLASFADINGDNAADALGEDPATGTVRVWASYYDPYFRDFTFGATNTGHPGGDWRLVGQADIDGTGRESLAWQSDATRRIRWWDPGVAWWSTTSELSGRQAFAATGDLDGDGNDDVVVHDAASRDAWLWQGRSTGGFGASRHIGKLLPPPWNLVGALDMDGDGRDDLAWHDPVKGALRWWRMDGTRKLGESEVAVDPAFRIAATGDYDGDGKADLVLRDLARTELVMWIRKRLGFAAHALGPHPGGDMGIVQLGLSDAVSGAGGNGGDLHIGDMDADGRTDLAWFNRTLGQFDWWRMLGATRAGLRGSMLAGTDTVLGVGDFDGDGRLDVLGRGASDASLQLGFNRGDGFAFEAVAREPGIDWRVAGIADIDGDGRDDVLWRSDREGRLHWWRMDGARVQVAGGKPVRPRHHLAAVADLDGDGRADLVWHSLAEAEAIAWIAAGESFVASRIDRWPDGALLVSAADLDGDGDGDLAWHHPSADVVVRWTMDGLTRVAASEHPLARRGMRAIGSGDFDGDGAHDIAWRSAGPEDVVWLWRSSAGAFEERRVADYPARALSPPRMIAMPAGQPR